jgi:hypothetical protein
MSGVAIANGSFTNFPVPIGGSMAAKCDCDPERPHANGDDTRHKCGVGGAIVENVGLAGAGFVVSSETPAMCIHPAAMWMDATSGAIHVALNVTGTAGCGNLAAMSAGDLTARFCDA